jgi:hypothetical protein
MWLPGRQTELPRVQPARDRTIIGGCCDAGLRSGCFASSSSQQKLDPVGVAIAQHAGDAVQRLG